MNDGAIFTVKDKSPSPHENMENQQLREK